MTTPRVIAPKKLIEVALPLDDINRASAREKSIRHGHPSTLHLWWARRPLAAARAVLFAQLVNDPSWRYSDEELKRNQVRGAITKKRNELFKLISELVLWENLNNEEVLERARKEIRSSWKETCEANRDHPDASTAFNPNSLPAFHDPFAGGGAIPLEAQRLGLEANASDLNPVALLINKAMIEIPPRFAGRAPVGPLPANETQTSADATQSWPGAAGLAEDVRRYGLWIREEAKKRIGDLYPTIEITKEMALDRADLRPIVGDRLTAIACVWARTVKSPNPAFAGVAVPLITSFMLSTKGGKEAYLEPVVEDGGYRFLVRTGPPKDHQAARDGTKSSRGASFRCLMSGVPITGDYIKAEGKAARIGSRMIAIVAEGEHGRVYLPPVDEMESAARSARPAWKPDVEFFQQALGFRVGNYGLTKWSDLFTDRQLVALTTLCDLVGDARERATADASTAGWPDDERRLDGGGNGATAYGQAVAVVLGLTVSRLADLNNALCTWDSGPIGTRSSTGGSARTACIRHLFTRQAIPIVWDFAEANPLSDTTGSLASALVWTCAAVRSLSGRVPGIVRSADAAVQEISSSKVVSTDPPYYDNIGYADLSDFFFMWLRRALRADFPELFVTIAVPKGEELVATPHRHGGREQAEEFFLSGMTRAMGRIAAQANPAFPVTVYYAFKQSETEHESAGTVSTGWETFLDALIRSGFAITGTWPIRTELGNRTRSKGSNALASSIVLVCRQRATDAGAVARKEFLRELSRAMPIAIAEMTADPIASIAPVDLAQSSIGPGIALFSRYASVLEADGSPMTVHSALVHVNKAIDEYFAHAEGDLDADTRFCIGWFEQFGFEPGDFGQADVLARAKGTSVEGVKEAGVVEAAKGKVRLLSIVDLPKAWDPTTDARTPVWEALHHMCRAVSDSEGEAGALLAKMPEKQDAIRQLAYRLYTLCAERKGKADLGRPYNELIASWPAIVEASEKVGHTAKQLGLL